MPVASTSRLPLGDLEPTHVATDRLETDSADFNLDDPQTFISRKLHPLLDRHAAKRSIDFSFQQLLFVREHPTRRLWYKHGQPSEPDLEFIPDEELLEKVSLTSDIRYMDVTCALLPGWKAYIHNRPESPVVTEQPTDSSDRRSSHTGSSSEVQAPPTSQLAKEEPEVPFIPPASPNTAGPSRDPPPSMFCGLFRSRRRKAGRTSTKAPEKAGDSPGQEQIEAHDPAPDSTRSSRLSTSSSLDSIHSTWSLPVITKPITPPLVPPVPDADISSLIPITVRDVLQGIYDGLQDTMGFNDMVALEDRGRSVIIQISRRRKFRPVEKKYVNEHAMRHHIRSDWLVDEVVFDGLVVTKVDGKGGMEVEMLTRRPTVAELWWYQEWAKEQVYKKP